MKSVNLSVSMNGTGYSGALEGKSRGNEEKQVKNGTVYAGNLFAKEGNSILKKQEEAKQRAGNLIKDQFSVDNEVTDALKELRGKISQLKDETVELNKLREGYVEQREGLKEFYGITSDSQEEKELELLKRAEEALEPGKKENLSKEEWEQINQMGPLTEYQRRAMIYDELIEDADSKLDQAHLAIGSISGSINGIKLEMLKGNQMGEALAMANAVMEAFSGDIIGMAMQEAKENVDKKMEEIKEAAKKAAEKTEAQEKRLEETKAEHTESEKLAEELSQGELAVDDLQKKLDSILDEAELLIEQRKGLVVDTRL